MNKYIFLLLLIPSVCFSAPVIDGDSGTLSHGNSYTVTSSGSTFGSKATAAPLMWETFENATVGQTISEANALWSDKGDSALIYVGDSDNRNSLSTKNLDCSYSSNKEAWANNLGFWTGSGRSVGYIEFWCKLSPNGGYLNPETVNYYQMKMARVTGWVNENASTPYPTLSLFTWTDDLWPNDPPNGDTDTYWAMYADPTTNHHYTPNAITDDITAFIANGYESPWVNITIQFDEGSYETNDAVITYTIGDVDGGIIETHTDTGFYWRTGFLDLGAVAEEDYHVDAFAFHIYLDDEHDGPPYPTMYIDNIYADNTYARVVIGDNSVYANCTHREIQIPTNWSANSVSFTVNQGSFNDGETAYVFVVDSDGSASSGREITFSSLEQETVIETSGILKDSNSNTSMVKANVGCTILKVE